MRESGAVEQAADLLASKVSLLVSRLRWAFDVRGM